MTVTQSGSHDSPSAGLSCRPRSAHPSARPAATKAAGPPPAGFEPAWTIRQLAEACYVVRHTIMYYMRRGDFKTLHRRGGKPAVEADEARHFVDWYLGPREKGAIFPATARDAGCYVTVTALADRLGIERGLAHYHLQRAEGLQMLRDEIGTCLLAPEAADAFFTWYRNPGRQYGARFPHLRRDKKRSV